MSFLSLFLLASGLSMDAFAVSVCKGLAMKKINFMKALTVGLWFGFFQALMPAIGYFLCLNFQKYIERFTDYIAFILLAIIGINMIKEALNPDIEKTGDSLKFKEMLILSLATSIDALAVGIIFAGVPNILLNVTVIGIITMIISTLGVKIGNTFGTKYKAKAEAAGGIILILLSIKFLAEGISVLF